MLPTTVAPVLEYDYLIVGGGASGLSLAYHIAKEPRLAGQRVLLVEPDAAKADDRTWRYWAAGETPFAAVEAHRWEQLVIRAPGFEKMLRLAPYRYRMVRAGEFYAFVNAALAALPQQFARLAGHVTAVAEAPDGRGAVATLADGQQVAARYIFDSRLPKLARDPTRYRYLEQHFLGWEIETDDDVFDPETVQFMDFRVPQHEQTRFVYSLPFTPRRALVEFTVFSEQVLPKAAYEAELRTYLAGHLGGRPYRVVAEEGGSIPMTDHPLPARLSAHILHLGTRAGRSKPSTGYTFARVQRHTARLVAALAATGHPPADATGDRWQFGLFDTLLLDIMQRRGELVRDIFHQLFERNPVQRIFRFLDEETSWAENLKIMNSVTPWPFMRSIGQVLRGRPGRRKLS
ncbi:FAD-dependent oxidoreductase [Hymenobacter antarcticus]|uniref:Lycopene cyclase family protein n=1 Tax=Hymenobacter antarcticus TaxID=486270 RepID=A0ABP7P380_9BACT